MNKCENTGVWATRESETRLRAACTEALTMLRLGRAATAERQLRAIQSAAPWGGA